MKNPSTLFILSLASAVALTACGKKSDDAPAAAHEAAAKVEKEAPKSAESPANALKTAASKLAANADTDKAAADLTSQLSTQSKQLTNQFSMSTDALKTQYDSIADKYKSVKASLPPDTVKAFEDKLPKLELSLENLQSMVAKFSPDSMAQLDEFKTKYESELAVAKNISSELMKLLATSGLADKLPKF